MPDPTRVTRWWSRATSRCATSRAAAGSTSSRRPKRWSPHWTSPIAGSVSARSAEMAWSRPFPTAQGAKAGAGPEPCRRAGCTTSPRPGDCDGDLRPWSLRQRRFVRPVWWKGPHENLPARRNWSQMAQDTVIVLIARRVAQLTMSDDGPVFAFAS